MNRFPLTDAHKDALIAGNVLVFERVLGDEATRAARATLDTVADRLVDARVGAGGKTRVDPQIRGDRVRFVPFDLVPPGLERLWAWFHAIPVALFGPAYEGSVKTEIQIACYPGGGAHYTRHFDLRGPTDDRRATAVWYPNLDWTPEHGGVLRAHTPDGVVDIEPKADRGVLFHAAKVPHEVLPAHAPRWAVSAFYSIPPA